MAQASELQNVIGICRGTGLEDASRDELRRATDVAVRALASARQAQRQKYPEVSNALENVAREKLLQAARLAELNGAIDESTRKNIRRLREDEQQARRNASEASRTASSENIVEARDFMQEAARDNRRNEEALQGLLDRYF